MSDAPLLVPTHKPTLEEVEKKRIAINRAMNPHIIFIVPEGSRDSFVKTHRVKDKVVTFPDYWFRSRIAYNKLLLSPFFWNVFTEYEKVLICQTDAILLRPTQDLVPLDFVFVGAPWKKRKRCTVLNGRLYVDYRKLFIKGWVGVSVGNGGLSLRKPRAAIEIIDRAHTDRLIPLGLSGEVNEDIVFSFLFKKFNYSIPTFDEATKFFLEEHAAELDSAPNIYGFHALNRYNPALECKIFNSFSSLFDYH